MGAAGQAALKIFLLPVTKSVRTYFRLHLPAVCLLRLIQKLLRIFWARHHRPPRLPAQPPMVPGHDRWLGGEAGRAVVPKIRDRGFWISRRKQPSRISQFTENTGGMENCAAAPPFTGAL
jgi:hypothetical protein